MKNLRIYQKIKLAEINLVHVILEKNISTAMEGYNKNKPKIIKNNKKIIK